MKRLNKTLALTLVSYVILANNASALITIDAVPVGNAGNANDSTGFGAVGYGYSMGKYEVTLNQYCAFLNAVGVTDTYGLYNANMATSPYGAGISRSGASGSYSYSVIGSGNRPVTYVSWYDSDRFVNWLQNGQPSGLQAAGTTETGSYTLSGNSGIITRNANWIFGLPTANEWYKAAYYQPAAQGGDTDDYWLYPTASNLQPNSRNGSASDPNSANYYYNDGIANGFNGGYAANNSTTAPTPNALTDVGAFELAASFYGTFDQGGNVWEWNDAILGSSRGMRGGAWNLNEFNLRSSNQLSVDPASESFNMGFRIDMAPEPSVIGFMGLGLLMLAWKRKRTL
jgi:formylglycine-generating enzyme